MQTSTLIDILSVSSMILIYKATPNPHHRIKCTSNWCSGTPLRDQVLDFATNRPYKFKTNPVRTQENGKLLMLSNCEIQIDSWKHLEMQTISIMGLWFCAFILHSRILQVFRKAEGVLCWALKLGKKKLRSWLRILQLGSWRLWELQKEQNISLICCYFYSQRIDYALWNKVLF